MKSASTSSGAQGLNLLLCSAEDRKPTLSEDLPASAVQSQVLSKTPTPEYMYEPGSDPNKLDDQGWGVIVPEGPDGKRLLELVAPLIKARQEQQGGTEVKIYTTPPVLDQSEAMVWRKQVFDNGATDNSGVPRYLLILGDLHQVPLSIQQVQSIDGYVGRLAFDNEQGYQSYVDKVLRWEKSGSTLQQSKALFYTVHDGTAATDSGYRALIQPGAKLAEQNRQYNKLRASEVLDLGDATYPSRDELLGKVKDIDPTVMFSLSHGAGAPRAGWKTPDDMHRRQGAMSFGLDGVLTGDDLAGRSFLPGGIWFMLACYGAGTPNGSAYRHWLEALSRSGQFGGRVDDVLRALPSDNKPFVASLPKSVLSNPNGPLAFMGHVDLAWTYSFADLDSGKQVERPGKFVTLVTALLKGHRCGIAFLELMKYFAATNTELSTLYDRAAAKQLTQVDPAEEIRRGHLWMLRQDLAGYILLGDPAVRLPLAAQDAAPPPPASASSFFGQQFTQVDAPAKAAPAPVAQAGQAAPAAPALDIDKLEKAIIAVLAGSQTVEQLAAQSQMPPADLSRLADAYRQAGRATIKLPK